MKIVRKAHTSQEVSTASMPDVIFILLVFFMVTTVMREFEGLDVLMPRAKMIEKLESKRHTAYIWATKDGLISVNDRIIAMDGLSSIMYERMVADPKITVSLKSDENTTMKLISDIHTQLREANALKLSYAALTETP